MENKAICWRNCHCDSEVSPTLSTNPPVCPLPSYSSAVTSCSPDIVTVFNSSTNTLWFTTAQRINKFVQPALLCITCGLFLSAGRGLTSFTRNTILSNALATVRSWILGSRLSEPMLIAVLVQNVIKTIRHLGINSNMVSATTWSFCNSSFPNVPGDYRPLYRYRHIELVRFKEYYGMPGGGGAGGHEHDPIYSLSIYARFSGKFFL